MRLSANGGCPAVEAECNDFQELRKELFRLRERQQLIEEAFESAYEGIVRVDPDGKIVMLNDTYARFLQVDAREVIGRHVTEVIENTRMHIVVRTGRSWRKSNGSAAETCWFIAFPSVKTTGWFPQLAKFCFKM